MDSYSQTVTLNKDLLNIIIHRAIDEGSKVLSKTFKAGAKIELIDIKQVSIPDFTAEMTSLSGEFLSSNVNIIGDFPLSMLLLVDSQAAMVFSDFYLKRDVGTTDKVDTITLGVVQELGNVLGSSISNVISGDLNFRSFPEPPIVMHDYAGSIFSSFLYPEALKVTDKIHLVETVFTVVRYSLNAKLFLLPDSEALAKLNIRWE